MWRIWQPKRVIRLLRALDQSDTRDDRAFLKKDLFSKVWEKM